MEPCWGPCWLKKTILARLGPSWAALGGLLGGLGGVLGASGGVLDRLGQGPADSSGLRAKKWNLVAPTTERAMGGQGSWDPLIDQFHRNHTPQPSINN